VRLLTSGAGRAWAEPGTHRYPKLQILT